MRDDTITPAENQEKSEVDRPPAISARYSSPEYLEHRRQQLAERVKEYEFTPYERGRTSARLRLR